MTPFTHWANDLYLDAYRAEIRSDIQASRATHGPMHAMRWRIARLLVRSGGWFLPEKQDVVGTVVSLLSDPRRDGAERRAA